ncbi:MAG: RluA family pseudouridine synthase [Candidatus Saccharibacteria bacterium]|nr:RluA family pseudouridine synthase [Candidatus Saccharibacteria bacterium]
MLIYEVKIENLSQRADIFIHKQTPHINRSLVKQLAYQGKLHFKKKQIQAGYKFKTTGQLILDYELKETTVIPSLKLNILYEDPHLLVINKPSGVIVYSRNRYSNEPSIASSLRTHWQWPALTIDSLQSEYRAGIAHRLDRATSGLLICGRTKDIVNSLQQQFTQRLIEKNYICLVESNTKLPKQGLIDKPIDRQKSNRNRFKVSQQGKEAQTVFKIKEKFPHCLLLEIQTKTGRTHQIRVHLASINSPIIGDQLYGGQKAKRLMLHASKISFKHPITGKILCIKAQCPQEFKDYQNAQ